MLGDVQSSAKHCSVASESSVGCPTTANCNTYVGRASTQEPKHAVPYVRSHFTNTLHRKPEAAACQTPLLSRQCKGRNTIHYAPALLSLQYHQYTHQSQHDRLQPRMLRQHNRDISHKRNVAHHAADNVLSGQVILSRRIQARIVSGIVVALRQQLRIVPI